MEDWAALTNHPVNYVDLSSDSNTSNNCPTMILFQHSRSSFVNSLLFALPNYNLAHYFRLLWRRLYPPSEPWLSRYRIITVSEAITAELEGFGRGIGGKVMGILWLQFGECAKASGGIILALKSKLLYGGPRIIFYRNGHPWNPPIWYQTSPHSSNFWKKFSSSIFHSWVAFSDSPGR